ncbi:site-specific integrase [Arthrobacter sp. LAPM80]|uniref:tyrosine-type recombinase/integrase n=1 Tax=Arthrobacter sp. LAPM80 TaxID=3141788 RepID=UPI00398B10F2
MSREPLPLGSWGNIHVTLTSAGSWRARTKYRDMDGKVRLVEARGPSGAAARRNLRQKLAERKTPRFGLVTSRSRINQLIEVFIVELEASDRADRTKDKYAYMVKRHIAPKLGSIRVGEATSGLVDHFIRSVVEDSGPSTARTCGAVLSWMFKVALRHDAVTVNPVIGVSIPRPHTAKPHALDAAQYQDLREKVISWERTPTLGRPRSQELHEIVDAIVALGVRPGELFSLKWDDLNLDANPPTIFVHTTVIRTTAGGVRIQDHPKTRHGVRHLTVPDFLVAQLRERRRRQTESDVPNLMSLIFPSATGTLLDANNVGKLWRIVSDSIGYDWVTLKTFRKANATLIARAMGPEAAAYQAGHSKVSMTQEHYIEELREALDTRAVIDAFKPPEKPGQTSPADVQASPSRAEQAPQTDVPEPPEDHPDTTAKDTN